MNTTGKVIVGFVLGALLGTATGLLIAPNTGRTTRKKLEKKSKKLAKQLKAYAGMGDKAPKIVHRKNGKASVQTSSH